MVAGYGSSNQVLGYIRSVPIVWLGVTGSSIKGDDREWRTGEVKYFETA